MRRRPLGRQPCRVSSRFDPATGRVAVDNRAPRGLVYTPRSAAPARCGHGLTRRTSLHREAHVPAERPPPQAQARVPRAHVDARRPGDPQAPPRQGAEAPLGLTSRAVERRQRLSRSRDFDAVYRQGRSVSTRSLTLHWFTREDDADGASAARPRGPACGRQRGRAQPPQAPAPRGVVGARRRACRAGQRLRPRRAAGPRRGRSDPRPRLARRAGARGDRQGAGMRWIGIGLVQAWRYTFGLLTPAGTCKYHPSCSQYAIDAFRELGLVRGGILAGWRLLRCNPWSHGGVDRVADRTLFRPRDDGSGCARDRGGQPAHSRSRTSSPTLLEWFHGDGGPLLGLVDRRARRARAARARPGHGPADPLDAEPPGARAGDEGDPAALEARPAAAERRADEVLPREQDQPGRVVPADRRSRSRSSSRSSTCSRASRRRSSRTIPARASTSSASWTSRSRRRTAGGRFCSSIYVASQLTSSYFMSATMQKAQRILLMVLPIVFIPFILNFPSGLMIYWLTTNLWTTGQGVVTRRMMPRPDRGGTKTQLAHAAEGGAGADRRSARARAAERRDGAATAGRRARRGASSASAAAGASGGERRALRRGDGRDRRRGEVGGAARARAARARYRPRRGPLPGRERGRARPARRRLHARPRGRDRRAARRPTPPRPRTRRTRPRSPAQLLERTLAALGVAGTVTVDETTTRSPRPSPAPTSAC